jgi:hypothetical protein
MKTKVQIPSISAMNNFQFEESEVRVWKHYKLEPGKIKVYSNWLFLYWLVGWNVEHNFLTRYPKIGQVVSEKKIFCKS